MLTLQKIDSNAFRREGVHPSVSRRWDEIADLPIGDLGDSDLLHLVNGSVGLEHLVPLLLERIESRSQIFRNSDSESLVAGVIGIPAQYWIDHSTDKEAVSRIAMRLNHEMFQHEYFTLNEGSMRDWLFRIIEQ